MFANKYDKYEAEREKINHAAQARDMASGEGRAQKVRAQHAILGPAEAGSKESEIYRQFVWNREVVGFLESLVESLTVRLQAVLAPESSAGPAAIQSKPSAMTPLGEEFSRSTSRISIVNDRLRDLLGRLEV